MGGSGYEEENRGEINREERKKGDKMKKRGKRRRNEETHCEHTNGAQPTNNTLLFTYVLMCVIGLNKIHNKLMIFRTYCHYEKAVRNACLHPEC